MTLTPLQTSIVTINGLALLCSLGIAYNVWILPSKWSHVSWMRRLMFITGILSVGAQITNLQSHIVVYVRTPEIGLFPARKEYRASIFISSFFFFGQYLFLTMCSIERYRHLRAGIENNKSHTANILLAVSWILIPAAIAVSAFTTDEIPDLMSLGFIGLACLWIIFCDTLLDLKMINMTIHNVGCCSADALPNKLKSSLVHRASQFLKPSKCNTECDKSIPSPIPSPTHPSPSGLALPSSLHSNNVSFHSSSQQQPLSASIDSSQLVLSKSERLAKLKKQLYMWYLALIIVDCLLLFVYVLGSMSEDLKKYKYEFEELTTSIAVLHITVSFSLLTIFKSGVIQDKSRKSVTHKSKPGFKLHLGRKSKQDMKQHSVTELSSIQAPSIQIVNPQGVLSDVNGLESRMFKDSEEDLSRKNMLSKFIKK